MWKTNLDLTSVYASAIFCNRNNSLFVATLAGSLYSLSTQTGNVKWIYKLKKPCFGSASIDNLNGYVNIGDCSGLFVCLLATNGVLVS
jgi:hypothetical protein